MSRFPPCAFVRSYVLNNLEEGPARVADLMRRGEAEFGFSRGESNPQPNTSPSSRRLRRGKYIGRDPPICLPFGGAWVEILASLEALPFNGERGASAQLKLLRRAARRVVSQQVE
jgi:hypothetical protein